MNIGIFTFTLEALYGGERLLAEVVRELSPRHSLTIYTPRCTIPQHFQPAKIIQVGRKALPHAAARASDWVYQLGLSRRALAHDLLIGFGTPGIVGARRAALRQQAPLLYYCLEPPRFAYDLRDLTGRSLGVRLASPLLRRLDRRAVLAAQAILAISEATASQVLHLYGREATILAPPIDPTPFQQISKAEARAHLAIGLSETVYLSMGKLHPRKQVTHSIAIFEERAMQGPSAQLYIAGDGPSYGEIEQRVRESPCVDRICMLGHISEEARIAWLVAADYFLFTARDEPFGFAPLEAQAAGATVLPQPTGRRPSTPAKHTERLEALLAEVTA